MAAKKKRTKVLRPIKPSERARIKYENALLKALKPLFNAVAKRLDKVKAVEKIQTDASPTKTIKQILAVVENKNTNFQVLAERIAGDFVADANAAQKKRFMRQIKQQVGIDLTRVLKEDKQLKDLLEAKIAQNASLIKSIADDYISEVEAIMYRAVTEGIAEPLEDAFARLQTKTSNRAKLIARDQTSKFNSSLNQIRQQQAGITKYKWLTGRDERVRKTHKEKEGKIFSWSDPPSDTGHPGEDVNCRCSALPIIEL